MRTMNCGIDSISFRGSFLWKNFYGIHSFPISACQSGFHGVLELHQYAPRVPPEVAQMLWLKVAFDSPVQIYELGSLKPLECGLRVPLMQKG